MLEPEAAGFKEGECRAGGILIYLKWQSNPAETRVTCSLVLAEPHTNRI